MQHPDTRHGPRYEGERRRLFRIPSGLIRLLSEVHPFFILDSSGMDPLLGFLALRRAQELAWTPDVECAAYNFDTGAPVDILERETTYGNRVHTWPEVRAAFRLAEPTTMEQADAAWKAFRELTSGHIGRTRRCQPSLEVTLTMNEENFGIESYGLEALRVRHSRRGGRWTFQRSTRAATGPARLENHYLVTRLRPDSADGGLSNQPRA